MVKACNIEAIDLLHMQRRTGEIDCAETIKLVLRAKGSRTSKAFSDDLGCDQSVISRILRGQTKSLSLKMIGSIVTYAAPESGVSLYQLLNAQGFRQNVSDNQAQANELKNDLSRIVIYEIINRGYSVKLSMSVENDENSFAILTNAFSETHDKTDEWIFKFMPRKPHSATNNIIISMLAFMMANYYTGCSAKRYSLVVSDESEFLAAKDYLSKLVIPDEISVILVSIQEKCVVKEYIAPLKNEAPGDHQAIMKLGSEGEQQEKRKGKT